jgi:formylglycine-generating enzyme required for sulfatase activity
MKEQVKKVKEFIWQKYVDYVQPDSKDVVEDEAVEILERHYATVDPDEDPECYYLGIILFELAFQNPQVESLYLAKAKTIFEQYRTRTSETDWDVVEDRLEEIEDALGGLGPDERASVFAQVESDWKTLGSQPASQPSAPVVEGMVFVPEGAFLAGEAKAEIEVDAFHIDTFPVTNREYKAFTESTGYRSPKFWGEGRLNAPNAPVVGVSWYDADKYATWAGKQLPTSEQWEKAARGLEGGVYPWGNEVDEDLANFGNEDGTDMLSPVDRHEGNQSVFGARDLVGNAWEWSRDWDKIEIDMKIIRGGSWTDPARFLRCDTHLYANPKDKFDNIGFRCVRPAD